MFKKTFLIPLKWAEVAIITKIFSVATLFHTSGIIELPLYNINVTGAGAIRSTIPDMAKYLTTFMNNGEYKGTQILKPESIGLIHSIHEPLAGTSTEGFIIEGYGYGWFLYGGGYKGHGGATPGFSSNLFFNKSSGSTVGVFIRLKDVNAFYNKKS